MKESEASNVLIAEYTGFNRNCYQVSLPTKHSHTYGCTNYQTKVEKAGAAACFGKYTNQLAAPNCKTKWPAPPTTPSTHFKLLVYKYSTEGVQFVQIIRHQSRNKEHLQRRLSNRPRLFGSSGPDASCNPMRYLYVRGPVQTSVFCKLDNCYARYAHV